mgnify:CR=1 FL=1
MNILKESILLYLANIKLASIFSLAFFISLLIPLAFPLPSFIALGGIFIRSFDLTPIIILSIVISFLFSLTLFSLAFVLIVMIVKSIKTKTKIGKRDLRNIESYTIRVFILFFIFYIIFIASYLVSHLLSDLVALILFIFIFYSPASIILKDRSIKGAIIDNIRYIKSSYGFYYFVLWLFIALISLLLFDSILTTLLPNEIGEYILLIITSLFLLPYLIIFIALAYVRAYPILRKL